MYYVYILKCADGSYYTGITTDLKRRFKEHAAGVGGYYTRSRKAIRIVYSEMLPDRSSASKREAEIKKYTRELKHHLIQSTKKYKRKKKSAMPNRAGA